MNRRMFLVLFLVLATGFAACSDDDNDNGSSNAPIDHTVSQDGVRHLPGLRDPLDNCTGCHGTDLRGGDGPSCYSCHGKEW